MIIGESVFSDLIAGNTYFSPWFPRGGNLAAFTVQTIAASSATNSFTVQVETKNQEDGDNSATELLGSPEAISTTVGAFTKFNAGQDLDSASQGIKELVRFKYVVKSDTANTIAIVHFRMLNPSWLSN